jgi:glycosyltransferase involved in cell wall biosynthesis
MLTTFYPPFSFGGDAIGVQRLSRALVARGHQVTVVHDVDAFLALHHGPVPETPTEDLDEGVRVVRLKSPLGLLSPLLVQQLGRPVLHARRLRKILAAGQWDVVTFHNVSLLGGPGLLHYPEDAVTVYMAHEHWLICPTHVLWRHRRERCDGKECFKCSLTYHRPPQLWRYTGALDRGLDRVDTIVAMSEFSRAKHREFGLRQKMEVLPYFLPDSPPGPTPGSMPPHPRQYFFFAGRLEFIKGLDDVIEAFRSFSGADLVIAGDGNHAATLKTLAADLPHVHFIGGRTPEELEEYYHHALALVVPSICYETFGIVLIEAFRLGTPVIARDLGPFPEILRRSGGGVLFSSEEELISAMKRLQEDTVYRESLGRTGAYSFHEHWTEDIIVPAYLDIVRRASARRGLTRIADRISPPEAA